MRRSFKSSVENIIKRGRKAFIYHNWLRNTARFGNKIKDKILTFPLCSQSHSYAPLITALLPYSLPVDVVTPALEAGIIISFYPMMNRIAFKNYQSMNMVHRTKQGSELWLGDYYAASNISLLKQKNIRSVLTSAAMLGISYPKEHNINHKTINAFDIPSYKMTPHFQEAFRFLQDALRKGNALVHCAAGISRSTTFVLVYLMRGENMGFKQSLDYVRSKRNIVCPNYGFQNELKRLELNLKKPKVGKDQTFTNYSDYSEKKVVMDFLNEDRKTPGKRQDKFSSTVSGYKPNPNQTYTGHLGGTLNENNGFLRGKSVNYNTKKKNVDLSPDFKGMSKNIKQYLSFKMENPKIITIKK